MELAEILWYKSLTKSGVGFLDDCADKGNQFSTILLIKTQFWKIPYLN